MSIRKYVLSGNISRVYVFLLVILAVSFVFNGLFQGGQSEAVHVLFVEEVKGTSGRIVVLRASSVVARGVAVLEDPNGMRIKTIPFMMVGQEASFSVSLAEFPRPYVQVKVSLWSFGYQGYGRMRVDTRTPVPFIVERGVLYVPEGHVYRLPTLEDMGTSAKIGADTLVVVPNNPNLYRGTIYRPWLAEQQQFMRSTGASSVPGVAAVPTEAFDGSDSMGGMLGSEADDSVLVDMDLSMVGDLDATEEGDGDVKRTEGDMDDGMEIEASNGNDVSMGESFRSRRDVDALTAAISNSGSVTATQVGDADAEDEVSAVRREMVLGVDENTSSVEAPRRPML